MKEYIEHTCGECIHSEICEQWPTRTGWDILNPVQCRMFRSAADVVVRKRGEWVPAMTICNRGICSECGEMGAVRWNFCPNCGADMRGEKHEAD